MSLKNPHRWDVVVGMSVQLMQHKMMVLNTYFNFGTFGIVTAWKMSTLGGAIVSHF